MSIAAKLLKTFPDFSLDVEFFMRNEILVLFGPSGAGKSVTLKLIAGLMSPDSGVLKLYDREVFNHVTNVNVRPQERCIGYMFQNHSIFPHMTVEQNIIFGAKDMPEDEGRKETREMIKRFSLDGLEKKYPCEISGGQQQRVALSMSLIRRPKALLLDEPFSALDNSLRIKMRELLKEIKTQFDIPMIFVTHDEAEANFMADKMLIYKDGMARQVS